jgi:hypothetical protein
MESETLIIILHIGLFILEHHDKIIKTIQYLTLFFRKNKK